MSPPPPIGSHQWDRELRALGVSRIDVDLLHDLAVAFARDRSARAGQGEENGDADTEPTAVLTGHDVTFAPDSVIAKVEAAEAGEGEFAGLWPTLCGELLFSAEHWQALDRLRALAERRRREARAGCDHRQREFSVARAAAWVLFHEQHPDYSTMMHVRFAYFGLCRDDTLIDWFTRQLAAMMVHGNEEVARSVDYSLGVDFFEDARDAAIVVPRLLPLVTQAHRDNILWRSGYITWSAKSAFYFALVEQPTYHRALAEALSDSLFSFFFGTVEARPALDIFRRIDRAHERAWWAPGVRRNIIIGLTRPVRAWVQSAIVFDEPEGQALPGDSSRPQGSISGLLALRFESYRERPSCRTFGSCPSWFDASEIFRDERCYGAVHTPRYRLKYESPFDEQPPPAHTRRTAEVPDEVTEGEREAVFARPVEWHAVSARGDESLLQLVGESIEFWPEGLHAQRKDLPRLSSALHKTR